MPHIIKAGDDGMWGTVAYFIKKSFSKKIVEKFYINQKWNISSMPSVGPRPVADSILYSLGKSFSIGVFTIADFESSINKRVETNGSALYNKIIAEELSLSNLLQSYKKERATNE